MKWFKALMAVVHRDGGHYLYKHGATKATKNAIRECHRLHKVEDNANLVKGDMASKIFTHITRAQLENWIDLL